MASSTPPPPCALTTTKPYQNHRIQTHHQTGRRQTHHTWNSQRVSLNRSSHPRNDAKAPPGPTVAAASSLSDNPAFPSFASSSKTELAADFSGRRSTRFVSKMHFRRPKSAASSRHSPVAEEALQQAVRLSGDDGCVDSILLSFESRFCGTDDYTFLLRELGNRGEWSMAMRCFEFAVSRERRRNEQGKLASSMISILGRLGKIDLAQKVFHDAVNQGYGNTVYAYSALISAYAKSGCCDEAIRVFETMKGSGLKPNLVTYKFFN